MSLLEFVTLLFIRLASILGSASFHSKLLVTSAQKALFVQLDPLRDHQPANSDQQIVKNVYLFLFCFNIVGHIWGLFALGQDEQLQQQKCSSLRCILGDSHTFVHQIFPLTTHLYADRIMSLIIVGTVLVHFNYITGRDFEPYSLMYEERQSKCNLPPLHSFYFFY